jgi:hypothetical protein
VCAARVLELVLADDVPSDQALTSSSWRQWAEAWRVRHGERVRYCEHVFVAWGQATVVVIDDQCGSFFLPEPEPQLHAVDGHGAA